MKQIDLPSGSKMRIQLAAWEKGRDLYQVVIEDAVKGAVDAKTELDAHLLVKLASVVLSSKQIEKAIWECANGVVLVDDVKITKDYFEPEEKRADYFTFLFEVAKANIMPFMKSLSAQYPQVLEMLKKSNPA